MRLRPFLLAAAFVLAAPASSSAECKTEAGTLWKQALDHKKHENWAELDATLAKAIPLAPKNADYVTLRGIAQARLSQWKEAKATLELATQLDPIRADAHFELAEAALHLGDEKTALVHYTKAIESAPDDTVAYASLADLYLRLGLDAQAERTIVAGEARAVDDSKKFALYSLHGELLTSRKDMAGAVTKYEAAKKSCGVCSERGQQIAFFNVGAAYAALQPPRKSEAVANLVSFLKMICKGAAAARYADSCMQAQVLISKLGGP